MKEKWNAITTHIRNWLGGEEEEVEETTGNSRPHLLREEELKKLRMAARKKNIPIHEALSQAIDRYYQNTDSKPKRRVTEERMEVNPLLRLEGLATRSLQKMGKGVATNERDDATIIR